MQQPASMTATKQATSSYIQASVPVSRAFLMKDGVIEQNQPDERFKPFDLSKNRQPLRPVSNLSQPVEHDLKSPDSPKSALSRGSSQKYESNKAAEEKKPKFKNPMYSRSTGYKGPQRPQKQMVATQSSQSKPKNLFSPKHHSSSIGALSSQK